MPPQHMTIVVRKFRGPNFRIVAVTNGWQSTYGMKKMSITKDLARPVRQSNHAMSGSETYIAISFSHFQILVHPKAVSDFHAEMK